MNKPKSVEEECYVLGLWFAGLGSIGVMVYYKFLIPILPANSCAFWKVLGMYCPGCGGTRAISALFHGQFLKSLWYHPIVLYTLVIFGGFMLTNTVKRFSFLHIKGWKFHSWHFYGAIAIVMINWIFKNILLLGYGITI